MTYEEAKIQKENGGVSAAQMKDFAFSNGHSYSLKLLRSYDLREAFNLEHGKMPGDLIKAFIRQEMWDSENHNDMIIVYHGVR